MTADEPMSTPDSGGLREAVEAEIIKSFDRTTPGYVSAHRLRQILVAHPEPEPVPTPDSADDATVGEREGCGAVSPDEDWVPGVWKAHDHFCVTHARDEHECACGARWDATPPADDTSPPADDANRAPVSGGLDEGEREAIVKALYDFPHAGAKWLTFRNEAWATVERILTARDAARVERLAAVKAERDDWKATAWGNADLVAGLVARAEAAEAERRDLVSRLGFGDNITEPMADNDAIVAWFEQQSRDASEWQESQLWRNDCYAAGHPDDEDCPEHDPTLQLLTAEAERDTARREAGERIAVSIEQIRTHDDGVRACIARAARIARADALTSDDGSGA